jgi:hypothetical protein
MRGTSPCTQSCREASPKSLALFDQNSSSNHAPGSLNDELLVRNVISAAIKSCGKSREQIAEEMSVLLANRVTARMITAFTTVSKELHRWPGAWDRAFCVAVGNDSLLRCRAEAAGYQLISGDEIQLLELGRQYLRRKRANEEAEMLERRLAGTEL